MRKLKCGAGFFILKTKSGDYYLGAEAPKYDHVSLEDSIVMWVNDTMIPYSNVGYLTRKLKCDEFVEICEGLGIDDTEDFKKCVIIYLDCIRMNPEQINYIEYMWDLI